MSLRALLRRRVAAPILEQFTQGLSPDTIALTVGVGLAIAVIPIVGVTTILSLLAAWALHLNQPIMQAINWSSYALQLLLIFPFIRLGEWIFGAPRLSLSLEEVLAMGKADPLGTISMLGASATHAVVAWLAVVPLIVAIAYFSTRPLFRSLARRAVPAAAASPPEKGVDDVA
jgi:uncharacterized protein (DUF2062 family)